MRGHRKETTLGLRNGTKKTKIQITSGISGSVGNLWKNREHTTSQFHHTTPTARDIGLYQVINITTPRKKERKLRPKWSQGILVKRIVDQGLSQIKIGENPKLSKTLKNWCQIKICRKTFKKTLTSREWAKIP